MRDGIKGDDGDKRYWVGVYTRGYGVGTDGCPECSGTFSENLKISEKIHGKLP